MKIPVFVSCPTVLSDEQDAARGLLLRELDQCGLEPRALGRSDYPTELPLREVLLVARHCSGGLILGFSQFCAPSGTWSPATPVPRIETKEVLFPTPWNHLEAGILFSLGLPLLVFTEPGITGGVFDKGVTDVFVHPMPRPPLSKNNKEALRAVFQKWQAGVRNHYYQW